MDQSGSPLSPAETHASIRDAGQAGTPMAATKTEAPRHHGGGFSIRETPRIMLQRSFGSIPLFGMEHSSFVWRKDRLQRAPPTLEEVWNVGRLYRLPS